MGHQEGEEVKEQVGGGMKGSNTRAGFVLTKAGGN